eukprot:TRINITY_DN777814_c0_g1_i1.p1 TRINITY_DN777814_c0_g1~~TRINITY_DN777814_c0_g1_i1.p1  ORF type:complete len:419 (-),score=135.22 TRINITY_DN777814_c0_g1_i1:507-1763(-)
MLSILRRQVTKQLRIGGFQRQFGILSDLKNAIPKPDEVNNKKTSDEPEIDVEAEIDEAKEKVRKVLSDMRKTATESAKMFADKASQASETSKEAMGDAKEKFDSNIRDKIKAPKQVSSLFSKIGSTPAFSWMSEQIKGGLQDLKGDFSAEVRYENYKKDLEKKREMLKDRVANTVDTGLIVSDHQKGSTWESFLTILNKTPIINHMVAEAEKALKSEQVQKVKNQLKDKVEDARQVYETSQNPWVYRFSYAWDSVFTESETGAALSEIKKMDPSVNMDAFLVEMEKEIVPTVVEAFLCGDLEPIAKYCTEEAFEQIGAPMQARLEEGISMDPTILDHRQYEMVSASRREKAPPVVLCQCTVQQIHCIKDKDGNVIEGDEDRIQANYYMFAMNRLYNPDIREFEWKIREMMVVGRMDYL